MKLIGPFSELDRPNLRGFDNKYNELVPAHWCHLREVYNCIRN